ncbi:hypothetical protein [Streptomyces mirabilis]|uniref:hypothetical protein n=1 Tax=Streptomyces mirabilis TaxID=68239 RepID=UPI0036DE0016
MQEWLTAVIGLLGAGVGAAAAMWGAHRAAVAGQEALNVQVRKEDERWRRDQRVTAYQSMIRADMTTIQVGRDLSEQGGATGIELTPEQMAMLKEAEGEAFAALSLVELCGPYEALKAARELDFAGATLSHTFRMTRDARVGGFDMVETYGRHQEALKAFRGAAREALGYGISGDW